MFSIFFAINSAAISPSLIFLPIPFNFNNHFLDV
jgi:hypothetical protein